MDAVQFMAQNGKDFWSTHPSGAGNNQYRSGPQAFPSKVRTSEHGSVKTGNIMAGPSEYESYPETDNTTAKQTESAEVLCGRCKTSLSPDTAEYCFYCCGWLCGECWEYLGECGHVELKTSGRPKYHPDFDNHKTNPNHIIPDSDKPREAQLLEDYPEAKI